MKLDAIFRPKSVAIIGASNTPGKVGYVLTNNLLKSGYEGKVYLINARWDRWHAAHGKLVAAAQVLDCTLRLPLELASRDEVRGA